jgi:hypothetical protein
MIREHLKRMRESVFIIGMELAQIRDALPHGDSGRWIELEFGWDWSSANRYMSVYERLGGDEFCKLRNLRLNRTTLYLLAAKSTPDYVRYEIVDAIEAGEIGSDATLDAEIKRRIEEARAYGVMSKPRGEKAREREIYQRDYAVEAIKILKKLPEKDLADFRRLYHRGQKKFLEVLNARAPNYSVGLITGDIVGDGGLPLTRRELLDYALDRASTPRQPYVAATEEIG